MLDPQILHLFKNYVREGTIASARAYLASHPELLMPDNAEDRLSITVALILIDNSQAACYLTRSGTELEVVLGQMTVSQNAQKLTKDMELLDSYLADFNWSREWCREQLPLAFSVLRALLNDEENLILIHSWAAFGEAMFTSETITAWVAERRSDLPAWFKTRVSDFEIVVNTFQRRCISGVSGDTETDL